jgi:hypothetical protein
MTLTGLSGHAVHLQSSIAYTSPAKVRSVATKLGFHLLGILLATTHWGDLALLSARRQRLLLPCRRAGDPHIHFFFLMVPLILLTQVVPQGRVIGGDMGLLMGLFCGL